MKAFYKKKSAIIRSVNSGRRPISGPKEYSGTQVPYRDPMRIRRSGSLESRITTELPAVPQELVCSGVYRPSLYGPHSLHYRLGERRVRVDHLGDVLR
jgi:hypothetical protein